jgi:hypothetical protein
MEANRPISRSRHPHLGHLEAVLASEHANRARGGRFLQDPAPAAGREQIVCVAETRCDQPTLVQRDEKMFSPVQLKPLPFPRIDETRDFLDICAHSRLLVACVRNSREDRTRFLGRTSSITVVSKESNQHNGHENYANHCTSGYDSLSETSRADKSFIKTAPRASYFHSHRFATTVASHLTHGNVHTRMVMN